MTKITYFAREIINNSINETIKFKTTAKITKKELTLTINYLENLPTRAHCLIYYNGNDLIKIKRSVPDGTKNHLTIQLGKLIPNEYFTLSGVTTLFTFGEKISLAHLKDGTDVLKFTYGIYQNGNQLNLHQIYLQIKE